MKESILKYFLVIFLVSLILMGKLLWPFASILFLAAVFAAFLYPLFKKLSKRLKPAPTAFIICIFVLIITVFTVTIFVGILSKEAYNVYLSAKEAVFKDEIFSIISSEHLKKLNFFLSKFDLTITREDLIAPFSEIGKLLGKTLFDQARMVASNIFKFASSFFMMLIAMFFLLIDGKKVIDYFIYLSPLSKEEDETIIIKFREMAGAILIVNGIAGILQGFSGGVYFKIIGISSPFLWGVVMGILAFLPILGIGVVMIPAAGFLFIKGNVFAGTATIIFYTILSFATEYYLKPKLVGNRVKMHPLLVFLAILGGLNLFGILGIIYGPLVLTFFFTLSDIYHKKYQKMVE
ncbi:MAG: AI-2E family transporter [Deltaproteobacteria bacterium]|nr:MAG: AI-2E family transporter [Deltaproteobacteria bacterium]